jgi:hypothetical protein
MTEPAAPSGRVTYTVTGADLATVWLAANLLGRFYRTCALIFPPAFLLIEAPELVVDYRAGGWAAVLSLGNLYHYLFSVAVFILLFPPIMYAVFRYAILPITTRRTTRRGGVVQEAVTCAWTGDGLSLTTGHSHRRYAWTDFRTLRETTTTWLLYLSPEAAFPIPKRAFSDDAARDAFAALVRARVAG